MKIDPVIRRIYIKMLSESKQLPTVYVDVEMEASAIIAKYSRNVPR